MILSIAELAGGQGGNWPPGFQDFGKIQIFRTVTKKYLGKIIIFGQRYEKFGQGQEF